MEELEREWAKLEETTRGKGERLFDANRTVRTIIASM